MLPVIAVWHHCLTRSLLDDIEEEAFTQASLFCRIAENPVKSTMLSFKRACPVALWKNLLQSITADSKKIYRFMNLGAYE
jgi:hypothetical protein